MKTECQMRVCQSHSGKFLHYMPQFHLIGLQEIPAGGNIKKQILNQYGSS
jgi:hypothetical protein